MPAVFVHGNPETAAIWGPLIEHLGRDDVVCLSPPGFGAPVPDGFGATRLEYLDWLIRQLEQIDGHIDLVGHDWGAGHVLGVAATRPQLLRSWAADAFGLLHEDYVWHDMAQAWRKPGDGEAMIQGMLGGTAEAKAGMYESFGMSKDAAADAAKWANEAMGRCILSLYRSADEAELRAVGEVLAAAERRPALAIVAEQDNFVGTPDMVAQVAERVGAKVAKLSGVGHWWMLQDPAAGAKVLREFWASV